MGKIIIRIHQIVFELDYHKNDLPYAMGVFAVDQSNFYLVGGEYLVKDYWQFQYQPIDEKYMSRKIYRFNPREAGSFSVARIDEAQLSSAKPFPIVETLGGITYVICRNSFFVEDDYESPSPLLESLVVTGSCVKFLPIVEDTVVRQRYHPRLSVMNHYVVGNKLFLVLLGKKYCGDLSLACFDAAAGTWVPVSDKILPSFGVRLPSGGRSVSICGDAGDVIAIGGGRYHVFLFHNYIYSDYDSIYYYAGLVDDSGVLLCYQEITDDIFKPRDMVPWYMDFYDCNFNNAGSGRVYAVMTGSAAFSSVLCVSEFIISSLSIADQIALESFKAEGPAREVKFIDIVLVKNYICGWKHEPIHKVSRAFVLEGIAD